MECSTSYRRIEIIGGGLAGLSLGIALARRGVPVTIHEAGTYPRHRVCGEFISGVADETLDTLGISSCLLPCQKLRSMRWYHHSRPIHHSSLSEPARGISRFTLDHSLAFLARQSGVNLLESSRQPPARSEGKVFCTGRRPAPSPRVGLKAHFRNLKLKADLEMHLGHGAYVGLTRVDHDTVNVCGLFLRKGIPRSRDALLEAALDASGLGRLASRLREATCPPESRVAVAGFRPGSRIWDDSALGDSAAMIPPFTGNGMSMAFESAAMALDPLHQYSLGEISWCEAWHAITGKLHAAFSHRLRISLPIHRLLTHRPGASVVSSLSRLGLIPVHWLWAQTR